MIQHFVFYMLKTRFLRVFFAIFIFVSFVPAAFSEEEVEDITL